MIREELTRAVTALVRARAQMVQLPSERMEWLRQAVDAATRAAIATLHAEGLWPAGWGVQTTLVDMRLGGGVVLAVGGDRILKVVDATLQKERPL